MQNVFLMPNVPISVPSSLDYEKYVIEQYMAILQFLDAEFNKITTLEQDLEILNNPTNS